jgi:hypothetical protein
MRTTWDLFAYHQWYEYHRLGTPALVHMVKRKMDILCQYIPHLTVILM